MLDVLKVALAKQLEKETKDIKVAPGVHNIDQVLWLRVKGNVTKAVDGEYIPTADIPLLPTLALVFEKAGFQRENAKKLLIAAMTEALSVGEQAEGPIADRVKDIETAMEHVRSVTAALPKKTRSGATKVKIEILEADPIELLETLTV